MKNGLLIYKSYDGYFNIGDYIQSLAAKQFLKEPLVYVDREKLDEYNSEPISMIMNGWFLHEPEHWPPSERIHPFFVSFHLNSESYKVLENPSVINYFKKHEPIGCRDINTCEILNKYAIKTYFTGCLTLTLGKSFSVKQKNEEIIFVDPHFDVSRHPLNILKYLYNALINFKVIVALRKKMFPRENSVKNLLKTSCFFIQYTRIFSREILLNATYIEHGLSENYFPDEDSKLKYAENLIRRYAQSKLVITSRIHCALPSLGLETTVLYIDPKNKSKSSSCRFQGLLELFNVITYDKGRFYISDSILTRINLNEIKNKNNYISLKEELINKCSDFEKI